MAENTGVKLAVLDAPLEKHGLISEKTLTRLDNDVMPNSHGKMPTNNAKREATLMKLARLMHCLNLRVIFRVLGTTIGIYPWVFLTIALFLASFSFGMIRLRLQNRVRDGYTPSTSVSRYEIDVLKEFFGSTADPSLTTVLVRAMDGGSMHRRPHLYAAAELHDFLRNKLSISFSRGDDISPKQTVRYTDFCGHFCDANIIIRYFHDALNSLVKLVRSGNKLYPSTNLTYPIAKINGFELHLERNFFGVLITEQNSRLHLRKNYVEGKEDRDELAQLANVTSIKYVETLLMTFRGDFLHPDDEAKMWQWEMGVYKFLRDTFNSSLLEVLVLGGEIVEYEMNHDAQRTAPYFAMGFLFMFGFCFVTILFSASFFGTVDWAKFTLAMCISLCPTLAITSTFGLCALAGLRTNSVMLIMPFLICGIGVNDAFLICHAWLRPALRRLSAANRLGLVLEEVGPSITITTLTNVITFGIGALTPTPEISLFCLATAIALGFAYIYTLLLFTSFLYFATVVEVRTLAKKKKFSPNLLASSCDDLTKNSVTTTTVNSDKGNSLSQTNECCFAAQKRLRRVFKLVGDVYCRMLLNPVFVSALFVGTLIYWYFAVIGTANIDAKLDTEKILPRNSPILEPHRIISHLVWKEYYPVTVIVNRPLDIRFSAQLARFNAMVDEFEALKMCKGKNFTVLWLRDYASYLKMVEDYGFDYFVDDSNSKERKVKSESHLDYTHLSQFLSSPFYKHYSSFLRLRNTSSLTENPIEKFWFLVTFHNTTDWQSRIDLMLEWRRVAQNYPDMNVTVWEVNGIFVDQMLSLKTLTFQTAVLTLACMTVVCAVFIQNPLSVAVAVLAIGSISVGVIGYLSWWHLNLDPVTLCAVLMSIGMSVDFTAHICYHFQLRKRQKICGGTVIEVPLRTSAEKLRNTINSVAWPMSQAGLSTVICVLPLICLQDYIPLVFVKTVLLVVIWGMFHGLVLMPALLATLNPTWLELNCYTTFFAKLGFPAASGIATSNKPSKNGGKNVRPHLLKALNDNSECK